MYKSKIDTDYSHIAVCKCYNYWEGVGSSGFQNDFDLAPIDLILYTYSIKPSQGCGPYQEYNNTWQIISENFSRWNDRTQFLRDVIEFITSLGFIGLVIVLLW